MKKKNDRGYMLIETLLVTAFVAGVLVFLFVQFTSLTKNYNILNKYNTVEDLYALDDIKIYILSDATIINSLKNNLNNNDYLDLTDCKQFTSENYCSKLLELENIDNVIITKGIIKLNMFDRYDEDYKSFIGKIKQENDENYRLIAKFKNKTFATIRLEV